MTEKRIEIKEETLNEIAGGWDPGETFYTYCPFCWKAQKHLVIVWAKDLECLTCHNHHRNILCNQGLEPEENDLEEFYKELGYVPPKP
ncbi:MAG: hypothetical protein KBT35_07320 [Firmicutes bacterium]|nr:hypothetical protein [Candidatus Colivicinus equi]